MRNPCYPLTPAAGGGIMGATLGRVGCTRDSGVSWYNHDCTQRPPHARVCVTLPRGTDAACGAVSGFQTNRKARRVSVWRPVTLRTSRPGAHSAFGCLYYTTVEGTVPKQLTPSDQFISAIHRGYRREAADGQAVEPALIWDHIVAECMATPGGFREMFAWDTSGHKNVNRIGTIIDTLRAGLVPGLRLEQRGRQLVVVSNN